jgi:putative addiction module component (TIGR02574 family)
MEKAFPVAVLQFPREALALSLQTVYSEQMSTLDISRLSPKERLDLIGELWDSLNAEEVQLTPAQARELDRRIVTFDDDAKTAIPWESVDAELIKQTR